MSALNYVDRPTLNRPVLLMGFAGWPNSGEIATGTVSYLRRRLASKPLAFIEADEFYDYTSERPTARINEGRLEWFTTPRNLFSYVPGSDGDRDLILFQGREPHMRWNAFCDLILDLARDMGVAAIFTLGGTYDYVPHWLDPLVAAVYSDETAETWTTVVASQVSPADYKGPVSIHTMLLSKGREKHVPVVGLWGRAPVYIQTGNVRVHRQMVELLKRAVGFRVDTTDLNAGIAEMDEQILGIIAKNPQLKKYVDELTEKYESRDEVQPRHPIMVRPESEKGKVISMEQFLRREEG